MAKSLLCAWHESCPEISSTTREVEGYSAKRGREEGREEGEREGDIIMIGEGDWPESEDEEQ